ncbi:glycosyltransferase family 4 protein [Mesorhizobium sp. M0012]|uniref:glycosyltransferase family 4 protein n=1 Tax=Mesorhizobium sp. M0012 TaxID=2956840 RepID=UPI003334B6F3
MIRVGFVVNDGGDGWIGGANYMRNLLAALLKFSTMQPVVITGGALPEYITKEFNNVEKISSKIVDPNGNINLIRKVIYRLSGRDVMMERLLTRHDVDVLSHFSPLGKNSIRPSIGWIADFQHIRLPNFFSEEERNWRDKSIARSADASTAVIVSSEDAKRDFLGFRPSVAKKIRVLRFVSDVGGFEQGGEPMEYLLRRYGIDGPYLHVPNQFWAHKNHAVIIDALGVARSRGRNITVVATGNMKDRRNPRHIEMLIQRTREAGCIENFKMLGIVPYADLAALMKYSVGVINPSYFEGWSTTVEEAKSLGKTVILSDIPVHREQAPEHATYFDPDSPADLCDRMLHVLDTYSPDLDRERMKKAKLELPGRLKAFARSFEEIVLELVKTEPS